LRELAESEISHVDRTVDQRYWTVSLRNDGIVWLARRNVPYPGLQDVHQSYNDFLKVVDDWLLERRIKGGKLGTRERTPMAWLTDMRDAPEMRNDPEFEAVVKQRRPDLFQRSLALGILVRTGAGRMQMGRITREKDRVVGVFTDPGEIVAWLLLRMNEAFA
jgi:hypothetical protein